jgi:flagellar basal body-associated protein FliL
MPQNEDLKEKKNKKKHEIKNLIKDSVSDDSEEEKEVAPKKTKKLLLIIVSVLFFLCSLIGALFFTPVADLIMGGDPAAKKKKLAMLAAQDITYLALPEITINLKKVNGLSRTLTASFDLVLKNEDMKKNVNNYVPLIQDQFNAFLREMTESDLEGIVGLERVSEEMLVRINRVVAPFCVQDVLIKNFYIK